MYHIIKLEKQTLIKLSGSGYIFNYYWKIKKKLVHIFRIKQKLLLDLYLLVLINTIINQVTANNEKLSPKYMSLNTHITSNFPV